MKLSPACFMVLIFSYQISIAQTGIGQLTGSVRSTPLIGMNTNAHHTIANWALPDFVDTVAQLNSAILRYPGGTVANHWDWQTGWFQISPCTPSNLASINPVGSATHDEFKVGMNVANAMALMVLNLQCSDLQYQLQALANAQSVGIPISHVELGNEHNLTISSQFISSSIYAATVAEWADSISFYYPSAKICVVGGEPPSQQLWHDSIFFFEPEIDALAFHIYLGAGNTDGFFNTRRALSVPFAQFVSRYNQSHFSEAPSNIEVWATEYNLGEALNGTIPQHRGSWTHALYVSVMSHLMMQIPRITMLINHNLTNQLDFAAIDPNTHQITANGVAALLLGSASKGLPTSEEILFPGLTNLDWQGTQFPAVIGWRFTDGITARVWVCNLSDQPSNINLDAVLGAAFEYHQYWADSSFMVSGLASLNSSFANNISGDVGLEPYSITVLESVVEVGIEQAMNEPLQVRRLGEELYVESAGPSTLKVYAMNGRLIFEDQLSATIHYLNFETWSNGIYLIQTFNGKKNSTIKFVVQH